MRRIFLLAACYFFTTTAFAAVMGAYAGLGVGYGNLRTPKGYAFNPNDPTITSNSRKSGGWAGRAFVGYNFNRFIGIETGWAYYPRSLYRASDIFGDNSSLQYNAKAVDAVIKAYMPIGYTGASVYILAGAAYVTETVNFQDGGIDNADSFVFPPDGKTHIYHTRPLYGVGASFDFPCHITTAIEFTQIQRLNRFTKNGLSIPFINLATFQLIYRFM